MKKSALLIFVLSFLCGVKLFAQDTLIFKSGLRVVAKVEEINKGEIKYRKFDNITGPLIIVDKEDINKIKYINGTTEELVVTLPPTSNQMMTDSVLLHRSRVIFLDLAPILFKRINFGYEKIVSHGYLGLVTNAYFSLDNSVSFQNIFTNGRVRELHGLGLGVKFYPNRGQKTGGFIVFNIDGLLNEYEYLNYDAFNVAYQKYLAQIQAGTSYYGNQPNISNYMFTANGLTYKTTIGVGLFTSPVNNLYINIDGGIGFSQNYLPKDHAIGSAYRSDEDLEALHIQLRAGFKLGYRFGNDVNARKNKPVNMSDYSK